MFGDSGITIFKDNKVAGPISGKGWAFLEFHEHSTCEDNREFWIVMRVAGTAGGIDLS